MKKIISLITALLLLTAIFSGCQKTPEKPVVIQKDMEQMIERAQETLAPEMKKLPLTQRYAVKEHLTKQIEKEKSKLLINVDADVVVPDTDTISITYVAPINFSQETVSAFFNALCGDTVMYLPSPMTKAYIAQAMLDCEKELAREDIIEGDAEQVRRMLERYKEQYAAAPDEVQKEVCDGTLGLYEREEGDFYYGCMQEYVAAYENPMIDVERTTTGKSFSVYNNIDQSGPIEGWNGKMKYPAYDAYMEYLDFDHYANWDCYWNSERRVVKSSVDMATDEVSAVGISPEDAKALGELLFIETQTPFSVQDVVYVASDEPFYELSCSRQVNCANLIAGGEGVGGDGLSPYWAYERVRMWVNGNGIIYFYWYSPYEIRKTEVENATLMNFEDIENIAYSMIATVYASRANQENKTVINVSKVALELARLKHSEDNSEALLVPVWCFYGDRQVDEAVKNEGMISDWELGYSPILIVNAIDGSVIDLNKGY